jgi:hypothetical protein
MSVVGVFLLLLPGLLMVSAHHHPPTLCKLVTRTEGLEGSDNLVEENAVVLASRTCNTLVCAGGPLAAILPDNTPVNYNYCKSPRSTVPQDRLNNFMLHNIVSTLERTLMCGCPFAVLLLFSRSI